MKAIRAIVVVVGSAAVAVPAPGARAAGAREPGSSPPPVTRPAAAEASEHGSRPHDGPVPIPSYGLYKVWVGTLTRQRECAGGCDQRVPESISENFIEFCGPDFPCDRSFPSWICGLWGSRYECSECNGPCGCLIEGRVRLSPFGDYDLIRVGDPGHVYDTFRDLRQLRSQYHCFDPAEGDSVIGAYEPIITIQGMLPGSDLDDYYLDDDEHFLGGLDRLTREGLESADAEETFLRLLSGAIIQAIASAGADDAPPGYYERALCLVEWQRAYTLWQRAYDLRSPMDHGFPYEYPDGELLRQLDEILYSTCTHPFLDYCTVTHSGPRTWGGVKARYR